MEQQALDVKILRDSFAKIEANQFTSDFYQNLFTDFPQAKALFAKTDMQKMNRALGGSLKFVVDNLENTEALVTYLKKLGTRHDTYGAKSEHYQVVGESLIKTFAQSLKSEWTPRVEAQWLMAYQIIAKIMTSPAN